MLKRDPRRRPSADELLKHSLIRKKLNEFGYVNIEED